MRLKTKAQKYMTLCNIAWEFKIDLGNMPRDVSTVVSRYHDLTAQVAPLRSKRNAIVTVLDMLKEEDRRPLILLLDELNGAINLLEDQLHEDIP